MQHALVTDACSPQLLLEGIAGLHVVLPPVTNHFRASTQTLQNETL